MTGWLSTMVDWQLADLEVGLEKEHLDVTLVDDEIRASFVLYDSKFDLTGNMHKALVKMLTNRLKKEWDNVTTKPEISANQWAERSSQESETRIGERFILTKRVQDPQWKPKKEKVHGIHFSKSRR